MIIRNDQVNHYNIACLALFIACYCDNVMLVMHCNLMSWSNSKLAASKLIHCCSFRWFSLLEAAADGPLLRVGTFLCPLSPLCHFLAKQIGGSFMFIVILMHVQAVVPNIFSIYNLRTTRHDWFHMWMNYDQRVIFSIFFSSSSVFLLISQEK